MTLLPRAVRSVALAALLGACAASNEDSAGSSADVVAAPSEVRSVAALQQGLDEARRAVPEVAGLRIDLVPMTSQTDYFRSDVSTDTALRAAPNRTYRLHYNPRLFDDPPPRAAVIAILIHELKHILDYSRMASTELVSFAIRYATADTRDYEHATDEFALARGWGQALKLFRIWLYAHEDEAGRREKMRVYYTPDEIDAFVASHPGAGVSP
jgi:hypothetical protein